MIQSCFFETPIATSYLRNNRSTRQKSLRCFPACDPRGHIAAGFCGLPLRARIHFQCLDDNEPDLNVHSYMFIAETRPACTPGISSRAMVTKAAIMDNIRTKADKASEKGELFIGDVSVLACEGRSMDLLVTFNMQHCSWDYSWKSNRWSGSQEMHVIDIIALKYSTLSEFVVSSSFASSSFIVISSHKRTAAAAARPESEADTEVLQASNLLTTLCGPACHDPYGLVDADSSSTSGSEQRKKRKTAAPKKKAAASSSATAAKINQAAHVSESTQIQGRDKAVAEGAETLMSLLGPITGQQPFASTRGSFPLDKRATTDGFNGYMGFPSNFLTFDQRPQDRLIILPTRE